jgi:hypothetical protein
VTLARWRESLGLKLPKGMKQECSFLKKRTKKLLSWGHGLWNGRSTKGVDVRFRGHDGEGVMAVVFQKFFTAFFYKKSDRLLFQ